MNSELEAGFDLCQRFLAAFAAGEGVCDNPDVMAAVDLAVARSRIWRKMPPTGVRTACRMRSGGSVGAGMIAANSVD